MIRQARTPNQSRALNQTSRSLIQTKSRQNQRQGERHPSAKSAKGRNHPRVRKASHPRKKRQKVVSSDSESSPPQPLVDARAPQTHTHTHTAPVFCFLSGFAFSISLLICLYGFLFMRACVWLCVRSFLHPFSWWWLTNKAAGYQIIKLAQC